MIRAIVESDADVSFRLGSTTDFGAPAPLGAPSAIATEGATWNEAEWNDAEWAVGVGELRQWQTVNQIGSALSIRLRSSTNGAALALLATDVVHERAPGIL